MRAIIATVTSVVIGLGLLSTWITRAEATTIVRSKSNISNNRVAGPSPTAETTDTTTETTTTDTSCQIADKAYSDGMFICYGPQISLTCKDGRWVVHHISPGAGNPPGAADVCRGAPFALPQ
jgi:hypothetical protein